MTSYFLVNNFHFTLGVIGAIVFIMMAWLSLDAYKLQKSTATLTRFLGFVFVSIWQVVNAFNVNSDVLLYVGFILFIIGLILLALSFIKTQKLVANAIIVIPAFSLFSGALYVVSVLLLIGIAYLAVIQWKREYNKTWIPFAIGFVLLAIPFIIKIIAPHLDQVSFFYIFSMVVELAGFSMLGYWVWQYMRLRIQESFVMIAVGSVFILATIVTLAFSTILIGRVSSETSSNLLSDVKVLDYAIGNIKEEAKAKAEIVSLDKDLISALDKNDAVSLEKTAENLLEKYQLGFLTIADNTGSVMLRAHSLTSRGDTIYGERTFDEAILGNMVVSIDDSTGEGFSVRAGAPVISNDKTVAVVVVGNQLDNAFADKLQKLTGLETFIYKGDTSVASSALDSDGRTRLIGEVINNDEIKKSVLEDGDIVTGDSKIFGTLFHSSYAPLLNTDEKIVGMISVSKPQQDIVNIANATNRLTLITVTLIILILSLPIYYISKKYINTDQ
jgi:hypothetical protein